ncbi:hypothetical protein GRJ2_002960800 [Grus japonensis]|uniref:Uncharacterized protein n=1 Tax=Grus japonensis TaxID=30415 RepID=A0ABC9Y7D9_GRUJA
MHVLSKGQSTLLCFIYLPLPVGFIITETGSPVWVFDLTLFYGKTSFQKDLDYFLSFLKNFFCWVAPYDDAINVLQVLQSFTLFQCSLDQPLADGGAYFHPWGSRFQGYWTPLQVKANCGLHSAAKGIEKKAFAVSIVTYHLAAFDSSSY